MRHVVIDEADTLLDHGFADDLKRLLLPLQGRPTDRGGPEAGDAARPAVQLVFVCAALTRRVRDFVHGSYPVRANASALMPRRRPMTAAPHRTAPRSAQNMMIVTTRMLHRRLANITHKFVRVHGADAKADELKRVIMHECRGRTMVFCNTIGGCVWLYHLMQQWDVQPAMLHGGVPPKVPIARGPQAGRQCGARRAADGRGPGDRTARKRGAHSATASGASSCAPTLHRVGSTAPPSPASSWRNSPALRWTTCTVPVAQAGPACGAP